VCSIETVIKDATTRGEEAHRKVWEEMRTKQKKGRLCGQMLLALSVLCCLQSKAQSLSGTSGLITIPTAEMPPDGTVRVGAGYIPEKYSTYQDSRPYLPYYASVVFLPFLEVGFRFSRATDDGQKALGDRMLFGRLQFIKEGRRRPALAVGVHDFLRSSEVSTSNFNALYIVASKNIERFGVIPPTSWHLGYGTDVLDARAHQFVGVFGGATIKPASFVEVMFEYDGAIFTMGPRLSVLRYLHLVAAIQNFDTFVGGGALQVKLP